MRAIYFGRSTLTLLESVTTGISGLGNGMILTSKTSKVTDHFYCLGPDTLPSFLLDCAAPAMFDAGMSIMGEHYIQEIRNILGNRPLEYLFLSHVHYDHCGAAGHIKKVYPGVKICASEIGAEIIQKPSAIDLIKKLSKFPGMSDNQSFIPFKVDQIVEDGQTLTLEDQIQVEVIAAPGHTRDMTGYYLPHIKTMLPSESIGVPSQDGHIISEFLVDYNVYMNSLEKLSKYNFHILVMAHQFIYTDEDAKNHIPQAIVQSKQFKNKIMDLLKQYQGDGEKVAQEIKKEEYDPLPQPKLPEPAYVLNLKAKIKAVTKLMDQ